MLTEQKMTTLAPTEEAPTEEARKDWVTPEFERTPLNEALAGSTTASSDASFNLS